MLAHSECRRLGRSCMNLLGSVPSSKTFLPTLKSADMWARICFMLKKLGSRYIILFSVKRKGIVLKQTEVDLILLFWNVVIFSFSFNNYLSFFFFHVKDFKVLMLLGKGSFACVYRAKSVKTGLDVAIKTVRLLYSPLRCPARVMDS